MGIKYLSVVFVTCIALTSSEDININKKITEDAVIIEGNFITCFFFKQIYLF